LLSKRKRKLANILMNLLKKISCSIREKRFVEDVVSLLTSPRSTLAYGEPFFRLLGLRKTGSEINLSRVKKILVVRVDEIGDVVMTSPFLRELRQLIPQAHITLVVKPAVYNLVELCPYVNKILTYDWQIPDPRTRNLRLHWRALKLFWKYYCRDRFDLAILPRWDADRHYATFATYFSGAPWRIGYAENVNPLKKRLNGTYDLLLTHTLNENQLKHEVEHNLDVIRFLGGEVWDDRLELWLEPEDQKFADRFLIDNNIGKDDLVISFAPATSHPRKQWSVERFKELGIWLKHEYDAKFLVIGGKGEESLGEELKSALGSCAMNAVGKTTLRQTAALLKRSQVLISNDTGPLHIAAALGIPTVAIFSHPEGGSDFSCNSPVRFGPWKSHCNIVQPRNPRPPCVKECAAEEPHCILEVTVDEVKKALLSDMQMDAKRIF